MTHAGHHRVGLMCKDTLLGMSAQDRDKGIKCYDKYSTHVVPGFYVCDLAGLLTRPYPIFKHIALPTPPSGLSAVVKCRDLSIEGSQQHRLSRIHTWFPFHPG